MDLIQNLKDFNILINLFDISKIENKKDYDKDILLLLQKKF